MKELTTKEILKRIHPLQYLAWLLGFIAVGILTYGLIRELLK